MIRTFRESRERRKSGGEWTDGAEGKEGEREEWRPKAGSRLCRQQQQQQQLTQERARVFSILDLRCQPTLAGREEKKKKKKKEERRAGHARGLFHCAAAPATAL